MGRVFPLIAILGGLWAVASPPAWAHLTRSAQRTTRFVLVSARAGNVELSYGIAVGEVPANDARRRMDLDHDGLISSLEQAAYRDRLGARLRDRLIVRVDGVKVNVPFEGKMEMLDNRLGDIGFLVEFTARLPLPAGEHQLELDDGLDLAASGEHEISFKEGLGGRFVSSARGGGPAGDERQVRFEGPRASDTEERRATFRFVVEASAPLVVSTAPPPTRRSGLHAGGVALLCVVIVCGLIGAFLLAKRVRRG